MMRTFRHRTCQCLLDAHVLSSGQGLAHCSRLRPHALHAVRALPQCYQPSAIEVGHTVSPHSSIYRICSHLNKKHVECTQQWMLSMQRMLALHP